MPHQCTKCGKVLPDASDELLSGCECGSRFFYYIKQAKFDELQGEVKNVMQELERADKDQIEEDIRELTGLEDKPDEPVILDLESVKVLRPGKFEIDIVNLFSKNRPLIYKLGEGKYIIDIASSLSPDERKKSRFAKVVGDLGESEEKDSLEDDNEDSNGKDTKETKESKKKDKKSKKEEDFSNDLDLDDEEPEENELI